MSTASYIKAWALFLLISIQPAFCFAFQKDSLRPTGIFELLAQQEITEITLIADMDSLLKSSKTNEYFSGEFKFYPEKDVEQTLPVKIRCRGKFRRMKCDFPPLKLKFKKDDLEAQGLNKFNELKLVTHCVDKKDVGRNLIIKEYLIYKLYNELTPRSLRTQLVRVNYTGIGKKPTKIKGWGILIEDTEDLADRMGGKISDRMGISPDSLIKSQENLVSLFQYMIANHDFDYLFNRNIEMVELPDGYFDIVPYDFDFSPIVSAPYARLNTDIGQKSSKDRIFMGNAKSVEELKDTFQLFLSKKNALIDVVMGLKLLNIETREEIATYLQSFFSIIENESTAETAIFQKAD